MNSSIDYENSNVKLMQRKRKRPEENEEVDKEQQLQDQHQNEYCKIQVISSPIAPLTINKKKKLYSIIAMTKCFICHDNYNDINTTTTKDNHKSKIQCFKCFKNFHLDCYKFQDGKINETTGCNFCELYSSVKCCQCRQIIQYQDIEVICEFCGNRIHLSCLSLKIAIILKRSFYSQYYDDPAKANGKEFFEGLQLELKEKDIEMQGSQKEHYKALISKMIKKTGYIEKGTCSLVENLFSLCSYCRLKEHSQMQNSLIYKSAFYLMSNYSSHISIDLHELLLLCDNSLISPSITSTMANLNKEDQSHKKVLVNSLSLITKPYIKRIIDNFFLNDNTNRCYYLIKWSNNHYSIELSDFISLYPSFIKYINEFQNKIIPDYHIIDDQIFLSQLSTIKSTNEASSNEKIINTLNQNSNNNNNGHSNMLILYHQMDIGERIRNDFLYKTIKDLFISLQSHLRQPKILLCVDNTTKAKWKVDYLNNITGAKVRSLNALSGYEKILYELIDYKDLNPIINPKRGSFRDEIIKLKEHHYHLLKYLNESTANFQSLQSNIILIDPQAFYLPIIHQLLLSFKFNMIIFDITEQHLQPIIAILSNLRQYHLINTNAITYVISNYLNSNHFNPYGIVVHFLQLFYPNGDMIISNKNTVLEHKQSIMNTHIKHLPCDSNDYNFIMTYWKMKFNWSVNIIPEHDKALMLFMQQLYAKKTIVELSPGSIKTIVNFFPIDFNKNEQIVYMRIIRNIFNQLIKGNDHQQHKNLIIQLGTYCSFPIMIESNENYNKILMHHRTEHIVSKGKVDALKRLLKDIGGLGHRILIIYSFDLMCSLSFLAELKEKFISNMKRLNENVNVELYQINDTKLIEELNKDQQLLYVFLFNVYMTSKEAIGLLSKLFMRENVCIFQLFTKDSIEQSLVKIFYSKIEKYCSSLQRNARESFISRLSNDEIIEATLRHIPNYQENSNEICNSNDSSSKPLNYASNKDCIKNIEKILILNKDCILFTTNIEELLHEPLSLLTVKDRNMIGSWTEFYIRNSQLKLNMFYDNYMRNDISCNKNKDKDKDIGMFVQIANENKFALNKSSFDQSERKDTNKNISNSNDQSRHQSQSQSIINKSSKVHQVISSNKNVITLNHTSSMSSNESSQGNENDNNNLLKPKSLDNLLNDLIKNHQHSPDKLIKLNNILLTKGFTYNIRKALLYIILDKGIGFNELPSWCNSSRSHLLKVYQKDFTLELLRFYIEYFIYFLAYEPNTRNDFLFASIDPLYIKSQILLIYLNKKLQHTLIHKIINDDLLLKKYHFNTNDKSKGCLYSLLKHILDQCTTDGFNNYKAIIQSQNALQSIAKLPSSLLSLSIPTFHDSLLNNTSNSNAVIQMLIAQLIEPSNDITMSLEYLYDELFNCVHLI